MSYLLAILWFAWEIKFIFFWLYLWQLKEYHVGRFLDHFRTSKGKRAIFSYEQILKLVLLVFIFADSALSGFLFFVLTLIYFAEFAILLRAVFLRTFKKPTGTLKTIFLSLVSFGALILFLFIIKDEPGNLPSLLFLIFDILTPFIVSVIVLFFQPFFVAIRNNTLKKAGKRIAEIKSTYKRLKVVAITGSYGKTSTKEFLTAILSKKFRVLSTKEHQNSEIGIARCILNDLKKEHQIFIAEVGAYNKGKVKEVCSIIKPKFGIVTGVNEQHLALFGSLENLLSAEGGRELEQSLPEDGTLFLNGDNKYCIQLYKSTTKNKKLYSLNKKEIGADIWPDGINVYKDYISFIAIDKAGSMAHFNVKVLGRQNVQNLLGAILLAKQLGMTFAEIVEGCKNITQEQGGMVLKQGKHGIEIIDSSYSSNPDGVFADLEYIKIFENKKLIVMPCLIELGKKSREVHYKIGQKIGQVCDMAIITTKDKFAEIKKGAIEQGIKEKNIILCDKPDEIFHTITTFCKEGDAVLLEGRVPNRLINLLIN